MFADFFQTAAFPLNQLHGSYDVRLVILSYLVATFASYIALDITGRLRDVGNTKLGGLLWLFGGAVAMGAGIWSMHFIGMLAFSISGMPMHYDLMWTSVSMLVAVLASAFALYLLKQKTINVMRLVAGGVILGFAIASMHYVGMQAMTIDMRIRYLPGLFLASIVIAIIASEAAIWLALKSNQVILRMRVRLKVVSAFIMGAAICGMHYTGMAAAVMTVDNPAMEHMYSSNQDILAISIAGVTFIILSIAFLMSSYKEAINQQSLLTARQAGMAEVAASVLHNVGNTLNSIVVSAEIINEKITKSKLDELSKLNELIKQHSHDLGNFISHDRQGMQIPEYLGELSHYWQNEKSIISRETQILINHIKHVKDIISLQQLLSKTVNFEQIISIAEIIEEALLVNCLEDASRVNIDIKKNYESLKPINIDKVKMLQIIINMIRNAKDSLIASSNTSKLITISIGAIGDNKFYIAITDNGLGILPENKKRIFSYGFTTKADGHGFGLHSSAIAANELGGSMSVASGGYEKGATFTLELPYKYISFCEN